MRLAEGRVFTSDSRTNTGFDKISTFRKMHVFRQEREQVDEHDDYFHQLRAQWHRGIQSLFKELEPPTIR